MAKERASEKAMRESRTLEQGKQKQPPIEDTSEPEVDFSNEEKDIDEAIKNLKAKKAKLTAKKRQAVGGVKLTKKRTHALSTNAWVIKAAAKFVNSVRAANNATASLDEYETKLGLEGKKRQSDDYTDDLAVLTSASEELASRVTVAEAIEELKKAKS